jgi:hypothetical protein
MTNRISPGVRVAGLIRGAVVSVGVATALILPAFADNGLPPPEFNIGGVTEGDTLRILNAAEDVWVKVVKVDVDQVLAVCDAATRDHLGKPYPAAEGKRLLGCLVPTGRYTYQTLVYPDDPKRPELAHRILLHEAGHLLGWPDDHRRD